MSANYGAGADVEQGQGWLVFAGVILVLAGVMRIFDGIWAFRHTAVNLDDSLIGSNLNNYGWLWLIVGIILVLSGVGVIMRSQLARWIGVLAGAIVAITAIWWIPFYPVWALVYIGIGVLVVYGLVAHGERLGSR